MSKIRAELDQYFQRIELITRSFLDIGTISHAEGVQFAIRVTPREYGLCGFENAVSRDEIEDAVLRQIELDMFGAHKVQYTPNSVILWRVLPEWKESVDFASGRNMIRLYTKVGWHIPGVSTS